MLFKGHFKNALAILLVKNCGGKEELRFFNIAVNNHEPEYIPKYLSEGKRRNSNSSTLQLVTLNTFYTYVSERKQGDTRTLQYTQIFFYRCTHEGLTFQHYIHNKLDHLTSLIPHVTLRTRKQR